MESIHSWTKGTLPYPTLPHPTLPYPILPYPYLPYDTLPYPTLTYPSLPYPYPTLTLPYPYPTLPLPLPYHPLPNPTLPLPYPLRIQTHAHNQASRSGATLLCDSSYYYPANYVCGRVYCFHVRPSDRTKVRQCVRNVLFP